MLPDDGSTLEDSICCPLDPSKLNASIIIGIFLSKMQINCHSLGHGCRNVINIQEHSDI